MRPYSDALTAQYHDAGVWQDRTWSSYVAEHAANRGDQEAIVDQPDKQQLMGRPRWRSSTRFPRDRAERSSSGRCATATTPERWDS